MKTLTALACAFALSLTAGALGATALLANPSQTDTCVQLTAIEGKTAITNSCPYAIALMWELKEKNGQTTQGFTLVQANDNDNFAGKLPAKRLKDMRITGTCTTADYNKKQCPFQQKQP